MESRHTPFEAACSAEIAARVRFDCHWPARLYPDAQMSLTIRLRRVGSHSCPSQPS